MTCGAKAALFFGAFTAAIVLFGGSRIAPAQAVGPPQPTDLAAGIADYANSEVDAAMIQAEAGVSQVAEVELPVTSLTATGAVQEQPPPALEASQSSVSTTDPLTEGEVDPVEVLAASPQPIPPAPPAGGAAPPLSLGDLVRHDLVRSAAEPKREIHASRSMISRSTFLRVELRTSATATGESSSADTVARSTVKSSASGGRSQRPAAPNAPLPFPPLPPNAPAPPNTGASSTGGGGGQGALLIFSVVLAALVFLGIHHLLRKVRWSDLRMPGRGASLPWRPG